jgi:hypothetical protein
LDDSQTSRNFGHTRQKVVLVASLGFEVCGAPRGCERMGTGTSRPACFATFRRLARSQSPFFHKRSAQKKAVRAAEAASAGLKFPPGKFFYDGIFAAADC